MKVAESNGMAGVADRLDRRMRLVQASERALSGQPLEAETLLVSKERFPNTWEELDLLARIRIREGKLVDALKLWGRGATIPTHSSRAHPCIASLQNHAAAKFKRERQMFIVLCALWSAAVVGVVAIAWRAFR